MTRRATVLTVSDSASAGTRIDSSGAVLEAALSGQGYEVDRMTVPDEHQSIAAALRTACGQSQLVLTTGGTGFGPRDVTPEATRSVLDRLAPGFDEAMRAASLSFTPHGMLSRGVSGCLGSTIVINMPGSPRACEQCWAAIADAVPHAVALSHGERDVHDIR